MHNIVVLLIKIKNKNKQKKNAAKLCHCGTFFAKFEDIQYNGQHNHLMFSNYNSELVLVFWAEGNVKRNKDVVGPFSKDRLLLISGTKTETGIITIAIGFTMIIKMY